MSQKSSKKTDLRKLKELGLSQEQIDLFLNSNFDNIEDWNLANASGFDDYTEWVDAKKGQFPTRADWILATYKGYKTYAEYTHFKKPSNKIAGIKNNFGTVDQNVVKDRIISTSKSDITNNNSIKPLDQHIQGLETNTDKDTFNPDITTLEHQQKKNSDVLLEETQHSALNSESIAKNVELIPDKFSLSEPKVSSESYQQQPLINEKVEEVPPDSISLTRPPPPYMDPTKFIDNPQLERIYRFAEVLYETNQVKVNDLTAALNFEDMIDVEEWLGEILQPNLYFISLDHQIIIFQDEVYNFIFNYLNNLHSLNEI